MANQQQDSGQPLTKDELDYNPYALEIPEDVLQLQVDTINVLEGRVEITTFPLEYQEKIKNFWRFAATVLNSKSKGIAKMTVNTLDLI
jgi:hypothetical protein